MPPIVCVENSSFPATVADGVKLAVENTLTSILGAKPLLKKTDNGNGACSGVIGIISFLGDLSWSFSLILPEETSKKLVVKFAGFEIPFDSPDMCDVVGELGNVIAGDIVARLDAKGIKAEMSLPMVARGHDVEVFSPEGMPTLKLGYDTKEGPFFLKLAAARPGKAIGRRPGT